MNSAEPATLQHVIANDDTGADTAQLRIIDLTQIANRARCVAAERRNVRHGTRHTRRNIANQVAWVLQTSTRLRQYAIIARVTDEVILNQHLALVAIGVLIAVAAMENGLHASKYTLLDCSTNRCRTNENGTVGQLIGDVGNDNFQRVGTSR